jgi:hypothetical protein
METVFHKIQFQHFWSQTSSRNIENGPQKLGFRGQAPEMVKKFIRRVSAFSATYPGSTNTHPDSAPRSHVADSATSSHTVCLVLSSPAHLYLALLSFPFSIALLSFTKSCFA